MRSGRPWSFLSICLVLCSCQLKTNNNFSSSLGWIELQSPQGWLLTVYEDGSGCLNCRAVGQCRVCFPSATFLYTEFIADATIREQLGKGGFRVSMFGPTEWILNDRQIADTAWAAQWFETAYAQVLLLEDYRRAQRRLRKHWRETPPAGVEQPISW